MVIVTMRRVTLSGDESKGWRLHTVALGTSCVMSTIEAVVVSSRWGMPAACLSCDNPCQEPSKEFKRHIWNDPQGPQGAGSSESRIFQD